MSSDKYKDLGASATKEGIHQAIKNAGLSADAQYFAHLLPDIAGQPNMSSFIHADGAGTKSIVSYLRFRDGEGTSVFRSLAQDALVMNLDDVYCLGPAKNLILSNAIARNSRLIPDSAIQAIIEGYSSLNSSLKQLGIDIELGGGETADCADVVRTLLVDAVIAGRIEKDKLISASNVVAGDAIIALSSTGQSSYETEQNSGIGSNGLTLARHCLLNNSYPKDFPECVDPGIDPAISYSGPFKTQDCPDKLGMSIGEALSSPTRTYAPVLAKIYEQLGKSIHGVIHLTGGAHTKVIRFAPSKRFVKDNLFPTPEIFRLIQKHGDVSWEEMYKVFNMGQRIELYAPQDCVQSICDISESFNIEAKKVGHVEELDAIDSIVDINSEHGSFSYSL